jgi:hypothetical protein
MKRTNRKLEVRSRTTELNQDYLEARATCGLNQSLDMGRRDPTHVAAVLHRNENPAVAGGFFISQLGPTAGTNFAHGCTAPAWLADVAVARDWDLLEEVARLATQDASPDLAVTDSSLFVTLREAVTKYHLKGWSNMTPERVQQVRQRAALAILDKIPDAPPEF